jgi:hypothetical protein
MMRGMTNQPKGGDQMGCSDGWQMRDRNKFPSPPANGDNAPLLSQRRGSAKRLVTSEHPINLTASTMRREDEKKSEPRYLGYLRLYNVKG